MVGALIGHSFVSGLRDNFSHCDRNCTLSKIARNLYVSDSVGEIHLVGASGACILRQEFDLEVPARNSPHISDPGIWIL